MYFKHYNNNERLIGEIEIHEYSHLKEIGKLDVLSGFTLSEVKKGDRLIYQNKVGIWYEFVVESVIRVHDDEGVRYYIEAYDSIVEIDGDWIEDKRPQSIADAVMAIQEATRWMGTTNHTDLTAVYFYQMTARQALEMLLETYQVELRTKITVAGTSINRSFTVAPKIGNDIGKRFEYDKDVIGIKRTVNAAKVVTALYGFGKGEEIVDETGETTGGYGRRINFADINGGVPYLVNEESRLLYGKIGADGSKTHNFDKVIFEEVTDKTELKALTLKELDRLSHPAVSYEADVVDIGLQHEQVDIGDTVRVIDKDLNDRFITRVNYLLETEDGNQIRLENYIYSFIDKQAELQKQIDLINEKSVIWDANTAPDMSTYLDQVIDKLNEQANATGGWVWIRDGEGLISMNNPDPTVATSAVQIIGGTIRLASTKKADGTWNWRTFIDGDKVVADMIVAGMLKGGAVQWNLETGSFLIGQSTEDYSLYWDGANLHIKGETITFEGGKTIQMMVQADTQAYIEANKDQLKGDKGDPGQTPYIQNGTWWVGATDTGVKAEGVDGQSGKGLSAASMQYYKSTSPSSTTGGSWVDTLPAFTVGTYLWTRWKMTWVNPSSVTYSNEVYDPTWAKLNDLDTRVTQSESSIKQNAADITAKVSTTTYTADKQVIDQTLSTLTQTDKDLTARFDSMAVGGTNLLRGSMILTSWTGYAGSTITETNDQSVPEWDTKSATRVVTTVGDGTNQLKAFKTMLPATSAWAGQSMVFSMYVKNNRDVPMYVKCLGLGDGNQKVIEAGEITRVVIYGTYTGTQAIQIQLWGYTAGYYVDATVLKAQLEHGTVVTDWGQHPDELITGVSRINAEGIGVTGSNVDVESFMKSTGFYVYDKASGDILMEASKDGGRFDTLYANDIISDSVLRRQSDSLDIYVGSSETGDGSGRDANNLATSITSALHKNLRGAYYILSYANITVHVMGKLNEFATIYGFAGHGRIIISGESGNRLTGGIQVMSCTCTVEINGMNIVAESSSATEALIAANNATKVVLYNNTLDGLGKGRGIESNYAKIYASDNRIFNLDRAFVASALGEIHSHNNVGRNLPYVYAATNGGRVTLSGTRPAYMSGVGLVADGGEGIDNSTGGAGGVLPTWAAPSFTTVSKTFYPYSIGTTNSGQASPWNTSEWRQGKWEGNGTHVIGHANFGSQIKDWLNEAGGYGGTPSIKITATRNASSGNRGVGSVSMKIASPAALTLPAVAYGGGTSSATAGSTLASAIAGSSALVLKSSTSALSDYAGYHSIKITVTVQKKV